MDKVSLLEAARMVDLHPNTIRNWRKAGKLKTAQKIFDNNVESWVVDPDEVAQIAQLSRSTNGANGSTNKTHDGGGPSGGPTTPGPAQETAQAAPGGQISPAFEQSLVWVRESVVKPLVEANERQAAKIEDLSVQVGTLQERVRQLEARLAESATPAAPVAPTPRPPAAPTAEPEPSPVLSRETLQPVEPRKGFWQRLFGG